MKPVPPRHEVRLLSSCRETNQLQQSDSIHQNLAHFVVFYDGMVVSWLILHATSQAFVLYLRKIRKPELREWAEPGWLEILNSRFVVQFILQQPFWRFLGWMVELDFWTLMESSACRHMQCTSTFENHMVLWYDTRLHSQSDWALVKGLSQILEHVGNTMTFYE